MMTFVAFIFVLGLLVFVHELGHFIAAKKSGIRVERFSLGFPPRLIGKKIGETDYCIGVIPLGGYVKMIGEDEFDDDYVPKPGDFMAAKLWKRFVVIAAGPAMNLLTAVLLFFMVYWATGVPEQVLDTTKIGMVTPDAPADIAGIPTGAEILAIDGIAFEDFDGMADYIKSHPGVELEFKWKNDSVQQTSIVTPMEYAFVDSTGNEVVEGRVGIGPDIAYKSIGPLTALSEGFQATVYLTEQMFTIIWKLVSRQESLKMLGGPVMIAKQAGAAAEQGFLSLLGLAAFLSVNLGILNILPIPVLDGGHLVFLTLEAIKRKPISIKGRMIAQQVGMGLLLLLMVVVTYNDIIRLFTGVLK